MDEWEMMKRNKNVIENFYFQTYRRLQRTPNQTTKPHIDRESCYG